jgi:hypothetical protein
VVYCQNHPESLTSQQSHSVHGDCERYNVMDGLLSPFALKLSSSGKQHLVESLSDFYGPIFNFVMLCMCFFHSVFCMKNPGILHTWHEFAGYPWTCADNGNSSFTWTIILLLYFVHLSWYICGSLGSMTECNLLYNSNMWERRVNKYCALSQGLGSTGSLSNCWMPMLGGV